MGQEFIGVYASSERAPSLGDFPRPVAKRKRLWFVWETPEGKYKVQPLNAAHLPMGEARMVSAREFEGRFSPEKGCDAVPEGYQRPGEDAAASLDAGGASLPDLFMAGPDARQPVAQGFVFPANDFGQADEDAPLQADDPGLLMAWAKAEPRSKRKTPDPSKIPFDRLVGEVAPASQEAGYRVQQGHAEEAGLPAVSPEQADQVRVLRSQFVQALLLLRRGEREASLARLNEMLSQRYPPFEGAAQLFSEFGLGLRRLGMISLALAAHKKALEFAPRDDRVLFNIARSYHDLDHLTEAREYLEAALEANPEFTVARQFLAFLEIKSPEDGIRRPV